MRDKLKRNIENNLTNTTLKHFKGLKFYSMTCFWSKCNFSAILGYYGKKYYCYYDNEINDIIIQSA